MRRKYQKLVVACTQAGYPRLRALSRKVGNRRAWASAEEYAEACEKRGLAIVDLIDNHGFSQSEVARLLDITDAGAGRVYRTWKAHAN